MRALLSIAAVLEEEIARGDSRPAAPIREMGATNVDYGQEKKALNQGLTLVKQLVI